MTLAAAVYVSSTRHEVRAMRTSTQVRAWRHPATATWFGSGGVPCVAYSLTMQLSEYEMFALLNSATLTEPCVVATRLVLPDFDGGAAFSDLSDKSTSITSLLPTILCVTFDAMVCSLVLVALV